MYRDTDQINPRRVDPPSAYPDVIRTNELNRQYLGGEIDSSANGIFSMTTNILEVFKGSSVGLCGGFGVGFPYHSIGEDGQVNANPEFARYTARLDEEVRQEMAHRAIWPCVGCQSQSTFLPDACNGCSLTAIKPRVVMRAMPDIDMFMAVESADESALKAIWEVAQDNGCTQSDFDAFGAVMKAHHVLTSFRDGVDPRSFLPLDLHVIAKDDMILACKDIGEGKTEAEPNIWSMYANWKNNKSIDFWFDFVFSMTPHTEYVDEELLEAVYSARKGLTSHYSTEQIIHITQQKSPRARVLLQHPATHATLKSRIDAWRTAD